MGRAGVEEEGDQWSPADGGHGQADNKTDNGGVSWGGGGESIWPAIIESSICEAEASYSYVNVYI